MRVWGADRPIRADELRHLLVASQWPVHAKGVRLRGARITGILDLESATLRCPLVLQDCYLERPVALNYATLSLLGLVHCLLGGLKADLLNVTKELDLSRSKITGTVQLSGTSITGRFSCRGAQITANTDGDALVADSVTVGRGVFLDGRFAAAGAVQLTAARIDGDLRLDGATLAEPVALVAEGARIGQQLWTSSPGTLQNQLDRLI